MAPHRTLLPESLIQPLNCNQVYLSREIFGTNNVPSKLTISFFQRWLGSLKDPFAILLSTACFIIFTLAWIGYASHFEWMGIFASVLIATMIATISEHSNEESFIKLQQKQTDEATLLVYRQEGQIFPCSDYEGGQGLGLVVANGVQVPCRCANPFTCSLSYHKNNADDDGDWKKNKKNGEGYRKNGLAGQSFQNSPKNDHFSHFDQSDDNNTSTPLQIIKNISNRLTGFLNSSQTKSVGSKRYQNLSNDDQNVDFSQNLQQNDTLFENQPQHNDFPGSNTVYNNNNSITSSSITNTNTNVSTNGNIHNITNPLSTSPDIKINISSNTTGIGTNSTPISDPISDPISSAVSSLLLTGNLLNLNVRDCVVGDLVVLSQGDAIPADGILLSGHLASNQATLTGEDIGIDKVPVPVEVLTAVLTLLRSENGFKEYDNSNDCSINNDYSNNFSINNSNSYSKSVSNTNSVDSVNDDYDHPFSPTSPSPRLNNNNNFTNTPTKHNNINTNNYNNTTTSTQKSWDQFSHTPNATIDVSSTNNQCNSPKISPRVNNNNNNINNSTTNPLMPHFESYPVLLESLLSFESPHALFSSTLVEEGGGLMLVLAIGKDTLYGKTMLLEVAEGAMDDGDDDDGDNNNQNSENNNEKKIENFSNFSQNDLDNNINIINNNTTTPPRLKRTKVRKTPPLMKKLTGFAEDISYWAYRAAITIALFNLFQAVVIKNEYQPSQIINYFRDPMRFFKDIIQSLMLSVIMCVVSIPEGLPASVALVLSLNMGRLLQQKVLVRKLVGISTSGWVTTCLIDKSGSLTTSKYLVQEAVSLKEGVNGQGIGLVTLLERDVGHDHQNDVKNNNNQNNADNNNNNNSQCSRPTQPTFECFTLFCLRHSCGKATLKQLMGNNDDNGQNGPNPYLKTHHPTFEEENDDLAIKINTNKDIIKAHEYNKAREQSMNHNNDQDDDCKYDEMSHHNDEKFNKKVRNNPNNNKKSNNTTTKPPPTRSPHDVSAQLDSYDISGLVVDDEDDASVVGGNSTDRAVLRYVTALTEELRQKSFKSQPLPNIDQNGPVRAENGPSLPSTLQFSSQYHVFNQLYTGASIVDEVAFSSARKYAMRKVSVSDGFFQTLKRVDCGDKNSQKGQNWSKNYKYVQNGTKNEENPPQSPQLTTTTPASQNNTNMNEQFDPFNEIEAIRTTSPIQSQLLSPTTPSLLSQSRLSQPYLYHSIDTHPENNNMWVIKGAPEIILDRCSHYYLESSQVHPADSYDDAHNSAQTFPNTHNPSQAPQSLQSPYNITKMPITHDHLVNLHRYINEMAGNGCRVLAIATAPVAQDDNSNDSDNNQNRQNNNSNSNDNANNTTNNNSLPPHLTLVSILIISDQVRNSTLPSVILMHHAGIRAVMISGDNISTCIYIAKVSGLSNPAHLLKYHKKKALLSEKFGVVEAQQILDEEAQSKKNRYQTDICNMDEYLPKMGKIFDNDNTNGLLNYGYMENFSRSVGVPFNMHFLPLLVHVVANQFNNIALTSYHISLLSLVDLYLLLPKIVVVARSLPQDKLKMVIASQVGFELLKNKNSNNNKNNNNNNNAHNVKTKNNPSSPSNFNNIINIASQEFYLNGNAVYHFEVHGDGTVITRFYLGKFIPYHQLSFQNLVTLFNYPSYSIQDLITPQPQPNSELEVSYTSSVRQILPDFDAVDSSNNNNSGNSIIQNKISNNNFQNSTNGNNTFTTNNPLLLSNPALALPPAPITYLYHSSPVISITLPPQCIKPRPVKLKKLKPMVSSFTGDGSNDIAAMAQAAVSFSLAKSGTPSAQAASDILLLRDSLLCIVSATWYGRALYQNIRNFVTFQLSANLGICTLLIIAPFIHIEWPLTLGQLLFLNLVIDSVTSTALSAEPPSLQLLSQAPLHPNSALLNTRMKISIFTNGAFICILSIFFLSVPFVATLFTPGYGQLWGESSDAVRESMGPLAWERLALDTFLTGFFTFFIMLCSFHALNVRTTHVNILYNIHKSPFFLWMFPSLLFVLYLFTIIPIFHSFLRTVPITLFQWFIVLLFSSSIILFEMLRKIATIWYFQSHQEVVRKQFIHDRKKRREAAKMGLNNPSIAHQQNQEDQHHSALVQMQTAIVEAAAAVSVVDIDLIGIGGKKNGDRSDLVRNGDDVNNINNNGEIDRTRNNENNNNNTDLSDYEDEMCSDSEDEGITRLNNYNKNHRSRSNTTMKYNDSNDNNTTRDNNQNSNNQKHQNNNLSTNNGNYGQNNTTGKSSLIVPALPPSIEKLLQLIHSDDKPEQTIRFDFSLFSLIEQYQGEVIAEDDNDNAHLLK